MVDRTHSAIEQSYANNEAGTMYNYINRLEIVFVALSICLQMYYFGAHIVGDGLVRRGNYI